MPYHKGAKVDFLGLPVSSNFKKERNILRKIPKRVYLRSFRIDWKKDAPKNLLLIYDIPEGKKKERDWFRRQLQNFNFFMIQRSVWVGPSPFSKEFLNYVRKIGLRRNFKIFKLAKPYKI